MTQPDSAPSAVYNLLTHSTDAQGRTVALIGDELFGNENLIALRDELNRIVPPVGVSDPAAMLEKVRQALELAQITAMTRENKAVYFAALALLPPIRISGDASDTPAEA